MSKHSAPSETRKTTGSMTKRGTILAAMASLAAIVTPEPTYKSISKPAWFGTKGIKKRKARRKMQKMSRRANR